MQKENQNFNASNILFVFALLLPHCHEVISINVDLCNLCFTHFLLILFNYCMHCKLLCSISIADHANVLLADKMKIDISISVGYFSYTSISLCYSCPKRQNKAKHYCTIIIYSRGKLKELDKRGRPKKTWWDCVNPLRPTCA